MIEAIDYSEVLTEVSEKNVNLEITDGDLKAISQIVGFDVTEPVPENRITVAEQWHTSPEKRAREQKIGRWLSIIAIPMSRFAIQRIRSFEENPGTVAIESGFLGVEGAENAHFEKIHKVQTMVQGAPKKLSSPFDHTTFQAGRNPKDGRILKTRWAPLYRRMGIDELPQIEQVAKGRIPFVGLRGYTLPELQGTELLIDMIKADLLEVTPLIRKLALRYQAVISKYSPEPAVAGLLQTYKAKDTPPFVRMLLDLLYLEAASKELDNKIIAKSILNRILGIGAR